MALQVAEFDRPTYRDAFIPSLSRPHTLIMPRYGFGRCISDVAVVAREVAAPRHDYRWVARRLTSLRIRPPTRVSGTLPANNLDVNRDVGDPQDRLVNHVA